MATQIPAIWEDSIVDIWNNLEPETYHYPFSSLYPSFIVVIAFTIIHFILDKSLYSKAAAYAQKQVSLSPPPWLASNKHASDLSYTKLSIIPSKKFAKSVSRKYATFNSEQQRELIRYQNQCNQFAKHISKYQEAVFKVLVFGLVYFYGLGLIFVDGRWFWDQQWMWKHTKPESPQWPGSHAVFNLDYYYYLQIGYHGHRALYQFLEHSRRDFWAMFVHHWVTVMLLCGSKMVGKQQVGATVLLCNDNCDLLMPLAKLAEYTGYTTVQMICTVLFCVLWIPLRIGVYFYKVIYSVTVDGYETLRPSMVAWFSLGGLTVIYLLQFYWTKYLLEMVWKKLVKGKGVVDVRSDDEAEDKAASKKTK